MPHYDNNHYLRNRLLKNFTQKNKKNNNVICVLNLINFAVYYAKPENAFCESNLYDVNFTDNTKDLELKKEANDESDTLITVPNKYDVMTIEVIEENWMKVSFSEQEGYIKVQDLTSETLTPGSGENCRKQKLLDSVKISKLSKTSFSLESKSSYTTLSGILKIGYGSCLNVVYERK